MTRVLRGKVSGEFGVHGSRVRLLLACLEKTMITEVRNWGEEGRKLSKKQEQEVALILILLLAARHGTESGLQTWMNDGRVALSTAVPSG